MKTKHFVDALEHPKITAAIADAERLSSGQIRVFITHHAVGDVLSRARERFTALGMEKTAARNGVLVFLAPESRKFAVVGDQGIHARCGGDGYWEKIVGETLRALLKESRYGRGGRRGGQRAGGAFPALGRRRGRKRTARRRDGRLKG